MEAATGSRNEPGMRRSPASLCSYTDDWACVQEFDADVLVGDVAYACALGQSELLRRGEGRGRLPRVMVSALPILDPLVPGRMENMPNNLAYVPQMGTSLSNRMVSSMPCMFWRMLPLSQEADWAQA